MHVPGVKYGKILFSSFSLFHVSVRSRMRRHNFATVSAKNNVKISSYSAYFELQNGIKTQLHKSAANGRFMHARSHIYGNYKMYLYQIKAI